MCLEAMNRRKWSNFNNNIIVYSFEAKVFRIKVAKVSEGGSLQMKRGEAIFFVGAVLCFAGLASYPADAVLLSGLLGYFGYIFMLVGFAMWWVDRKKRLKRYIDQRVKAEVERQLQEWKEEQESQT